MMAYIYTGCTQIDTVILPADGYVQLTIENLDGPKGERYAQICLTPSEAGQFAQALIDDARKLQEEYEANVARVTAFERKAAQEAEDG